MHLSAINLRGFKSFPDRVELRLEPGVAVVVGPNGSGKSNVADAIVWAAGSLSPSELRAEKPDDVLFAGGRAREPADFCEVELVFDNADGASGLPYAELSIARRLHRGGEGQYLLNGAAVRRTDLVELLADLGLGTSMHSIVGQGRVEEILAATPERRRELVEEAAGLGRFKRRRHRAELKLARVAQQLERARDLEAEVRARLRPLALQASAAERAERLGREAAGIAARIAELDLEAAGARAADAEERRTAAEVARRLAGERLEALLADRARAEDELADAAGRREAATAALYRLRSASERVALRRETAEAALQDARRVLAEARDGGVDESALAEARADATTTAQARERALEAVVGDADERAAAARRELDALLARRPGVLAAEREAAETRERAFERAQRLRRAHDRAETRREAAAAVLARLREEQAEAEAVERAGASPRELEERALAARGEARAAASRRDALSDAIESARERLAVLDRSLAEREGLPPAVRALAERGVRVAVAELAPEPGGERAAAAALGWRASALLAPDARSALELLRRAHEEGLGSVAVLVGRSPRELVEAARVVPLDQLLQADTLAVTPEGYGFDPARGELWFVGEAAEAVQLELASRRQALAAELAALERELPPAAEAAERAAEEAAAAEAAFAAVAPLAHRPGAALLGRLAAAAERLHAALVATAAPLERADAAASAARARADDIAATATADAAREVELRGVLGELDERRRLAEREPAVAEAVARAHAAEQRVRDLEARAASAARTDAGALTRVANGLDRVLAALDTAGHACGRLEPALRARADAGAARTVSLADELRRLGAAEVELRRAAAEAGDRMSAAEVELARIEADAAEARRRLAEAGAEPAASDDAREGLVARLERLERRREELGRVNPLAREEYERERERLDELVEQRADVEASLAELERLRAELTETVERRFAETYTAVEKHFAEVAAALFPGGEGRLRLSEPEAEVAEARDEIAGGTPRFPQTASRGPLARTGRSAAGVEIELRPAGKRITRLSLLSGGEKALGAISFLFALFLARPCPFYLLDEVEAALDDANIGRFVGLLRRYADRAQFLVITHQKRTIEAADVLYGVTMAADGVSRVVSRRLPQEDRAELATA